MTDGERLPTEADAARAGWVEYEQLHGGADSTVVGDLRVLPRLGAPQLEGRDREILVLLPDGAFASGRRYPVLYMHDGQNLFDAATSFAGEWQVDETMAGLRSEGIEAIVAGIPNSASHRFAEYTPFATTRPRGGWGANTPPWARHEAGAGSAYLSYLVDAVKAAVDAAFPTRRDPASTGTMGSSLGALISLWALCARPDVFGFAGAMSLAFPDRQDALIEVLRRQAAHGRRVYLDTGGREGSAHDDDEDGRKWSLAFARDVRRTRDSLLEAGFRPGIDLMYVEDPEAIHHETAWARRLPDALRFLLGPLRDGTAD